MSIKSRNKVSVTFSMSSLTDIVFLLLIFFIILSTLVNPYGAKIDLPNANIRTNEKPRVTVIINKNLEYFVNEKSVSPEEVEKILVEKVAALTPEGKDKTALLKVDESVPTGFTINMFAVARNNGIKMVIATQAEKQ